MSKIQFETMRNGYNRYQVDDCIGRMSDDLDELKKSWSCIRIAVKH